MDTPGRHETEAERLDRNLGELLQELRVAQTGVQVLFAFLLTVPFSMRFDDLSALQRSAYFTALMSAALASVLLIGLTSVHRLLFRLGQRRYTVRVGNRMAIGGLALIAVAMTSAILLVCDIMFGDAVAAGITVTVALAFAILWYAVPLVHRARIDGPDEPPPVRQDHLEP